MKRKLALTVLIIVSGLAAVAIVAAIIGSITTIPIMQVTRTTTATREQVWALWADVPNRTRWDAALEYAKLDGAFQTGASGEVKLQGQPAIPFIITDYEPLEGYTDRFLLPLYGKMDWHHRLRETEHGLEVTFEVEVSGPTAFVLAPIMRNILRDELPPTVDQLIAVAEDS